MYISLTSATELRAERSAHAQSMVPSHNGGKINCIWHHGYASQQRNSGPSRRQRELRPSTCWKVRGEENGFVTYTVSAYMSCLL